MGLEVSVFCLADGKFFFLFLHTHTYIYILFFFGFFRVRSTPPPLLTLAARAVVRSTPPARLGDTLKNLPPSFYDTIALCVAYPLASRLQ